MSAVVGISMPLPTDSAFSMTFWANVGIQQIERMPMKAVGLPSSCGRRGSTPKDILSETDRFKMGGINAASISAEMIKCQPNGNRPNQEFVGEAMCREGTSVNFEARITQLAMLAIPFPASIGLLDLRPESFDGSILGAHRKATPFGVRRLGVQASRPPLLFTSILPQVRGNY